MRGERGGLRAAAVMAGHLARSLWGSRGRRLSLGLTLSTLRSAIGQERELIFDIRLMISSHPFILESLVIVVVTLIVEYMHRYSLQLRTLRDKVRQSERSHI